MSEIARAFAPASIANLAVGYDIMGLAIEGPGDEVEVRKVAEKGVRISAIHGTDKPLPLEAKRNTAGFAALRMLEAVQADFGLEMEIWKKMPFGSGMGSSAASSAAAVRATQQVLGNPFDDTQLSHFAMLGESVASGSIHGDNVIPSLLGGLILIRENEPIDFLRLPVPSQLQVMLIHPDMEILTSEARNLLSDEVSLTKMIRQTAETASFVHALHTGDFALMSRCMNDHVIEPQRAKLIPHFGKLQRLALDQGALNYTISGAGPSMFAFCKGVDSATRVGDAVKGLLAEQNVDSRVYISGVNMLGAHLLDT